MSSARHHAEWLSLLEVSGPFLSLPVLMRVFPNELEARDADQAQELNLAYADWCERGERDASVHRLWGRYVLERVLGYGSTLLAEGAAIPPGLEARMAEYGETLRPDLAVVLRSAGVEKPEIGLLIQIYPATQKLDSPVKDRSWKASPDTRMAELLHGAGVTLGLVTNGERWMLVHAPRGETTGFASWYADLWMQEPLALRSFYSLLNSQRLVGVAAGDRLVDLLGESAKDQQEVTDQLGYQVRRAVEVFVQSLDKIDQDTGRELLKDVHEKDIYNGALTVMMRLVFLFKAEELGLLLLGEELYDANYAVSTLRDQLRERADQYGEEILERRSDAWCRLLSIFRAVYAGTEHDTLRLPPYGGTLLDPDRFPFLEGRKSNTSWRNNAASPLAINNRVVLHLLEALQILRVKIPGGGPPEPRRLSFRSLDIEQIGHVYEGLLDHTAKRATEVVLGLSGNRDCEAEISLAKLEALSAQGGDKLVEFLRDRTGRSSRALEKALAAESLSDDNRLRLGVDGDQKLAGRIQPYVGLLREGSFGQLVIIKPRGVFVTSGSDRRSTGTHYTPRSLTEPIVQQTLEPLVYIGPKEGVPKSQWVLRSPREILALKVCDMAMGSGAFLVQACRYLAERLVEAWEKLEKANADQIIITPEGDLSKGSPVERLLPLDQAERVTVARRFVADRCLYGVDINPMAVEMAKLSLWLITLQRDRPFTFLDHALKFGDSLLGVSGIKQIENFSLRPGERQATFATASLTQLVEESSLRRRALEDLPSNDHLQIETKNRLHAEAEAAVAKVKALADTLLAFELRGLDGERYEQQLSEAASQAEVAMKGSLHQFQRFASKLLNGRRPFHWPLEFPEVFRREGFDAFVGNPPFLGGARISGLLGDSYLSYLLTSNTGSIGNADLSSYFLRRVIELLRREGVAGIITTNSIAKGETRESGLQYLMDSGITLYNAVKSQPWPGVANVFVSVVNPYNGIWKGTTLLDGKIVRGISSFLDSHDSEFKPRRLPGNLGIVFRGPTVGGEGFILTAAEANGFRKQLPKCGEIIKPFLTGHDINQDPEQRSDRFVIDFGSMDEKEARRFGPCWERLYATVRLQRLGNKIKQREQFWWRFIGRQGKLYEAIDRYDKVLACGEVSKYWGATWIEAKQVFAGKVVIFALPGDAHFALLNSCFHVEWAEKTSSRLKGDPAYSLAETFETLPFPMPLLASRLGHFVSKEDSVLVEAMADAGKATHVHGQALMKRRSEGLTDIYNRFHDLTQQSVDIVQLRAYHVALDKTVGAGYKWTDLDLGHGFHKTKQGIRYSISEQARREILDRLLALNHQRFDYEIKSGSSGRKSKNKASRKKSSSSLEMQQTLIPDAQRELF